MTENIMKTVKFLLLFCCILGLACGDGSDEGITVSEVTDDDATLREFVEYAAGRLQGSASFEEAMQLINEFREVGGDWNDGSTYLVLLTKNGSVYIHAKNRKLEDQDWSNLEDARGKNVGQLFLREEGGFVGYHGEDGDPKVSYAFPFAATSVPLTNPLAPEGQELVLVGGFDYEPPEVSEKASYEQLSDSYNLRQFSPTTEARYVDTREELKQFVEESILFFTGALARGGSGHSVAGDAAGNIDVVLLRRIFRLENGPWRYGSTYIYIMDDRGNVVFNGANRNLEQTNLWKFVGDDGEDKVIQRIIAATKMPGGDFVEYNWNDPEDPNDDPPGGGAGGSSPKLGYAKAVRIDKSDPMSPVYVFGSGLYNPERLNQPKEEPGR